ncbi:MAG: hypothetical protein LBG80_17010 [Bacteroidales bacterium]|jgi:hypothetical protein|nr:hypothetical protein [Bacteroidales bacterium]
MINITLNDKTKRDIECSTGISFSDIEKLDFDEIEKHIVKKIRKSIVRDYKNVDRRLPARGNVFLSLRRYIKLSDIDKRLNKI